MAEMDAEQLAITNMIPNLCPKLTIQDMAEIFGAYAMELGIDSFQHEAIDEAHTRFTQETREMTPEELYIADYTLGRLMGLAASFGAEVRLERGRRE